MSWHVYRVVGALVVYLWNAISVHGWWPVKRQVRRLRKFLGQREVWFWLATWAGCAGMGYALLEVSPAKVASTIFTLLAVGVVARRLYVGIIAIMFVVASFFLYSIIPKPITAGGQGFEASELLILFMFVVLIAKSFKRGRLEILQSPLSLPVFVLCSAVVMSILVSYLRYTADPRGVFPFKHVYNTARPMFHYLFFFVVAFGISDRRQLEIVLKSLIVIGALVGVLMIAQYIVGPEHRIFAVQWWQAASLRVEALSEEERDVTRSLPPGMFAMPFLLIMSILLACTAEKRQRVFYGICGASIGIGIVFTFTRSLWLPVMSALVLTWTLSAGRVRKQLAIYTVVLVAAVLLGSFGVAKVAPGAAGQRFGKAVTERFLSMFETKKVVASSSIQNRIDENRYAVGLIKQHPISGIGVGNPVHYKVWTRPGMYTRLIYPVYAIHNSYLELWVVYGLPAVLAFIAIAILVLVRSFVLYRRATDPFVKALALGVFCGWLVSLMNGVVAMTFLHHVGAICVNAVMWGSLEVAWRLYKQEIATQGLDFPSDPRVNGGVWQNVPGVSSAA